MHATRPRFAIGLVLVLVVPGITTRRALRAWDGDGDGSARILGELAAWHKVTLDLDGPFAHELDGDPNPFLDYRMTVRFEHASGSPRYDVPGYFAADGDAANTSADSGTRWRAHLSPDAPGKWSYRVSFVRGAGVAVDLDAAGSAVAPYDGVSGSFEVAPSDVPATSRDLRGKGRLRWVGKHHLQFANGEFFLKAGADAPENLLAYADFDNTPDHGGRRKSWQPHVRDWRPGDPTWQDGRGKGLIGAIDYLASEGMNAFSFLTYNHNGDDKNVYPYVDPNERTRIDVSKLAQWEIVLEHGTRSGMFLHFKLQEQENDQDLDGGALGVERKLYFRELVARFAHHLALNWNLGEENTNTAEQCRDFARWFAAIDPYDHPVVVHTFPDKKAEIYTPLLGAQSLLVGASLQSCPKQIHDETVFWRAQSALAGRSWVIANDEQCPATTGVKPDADDPGHDEIRKLVLWGHLMGGGAGVELYFGYGFAHSDLTCEDFRSRDRMWDQCRHALEFFATGDVPFDEMESHDELTGKDGVWCLAGAGHFAVYLRDGGDASLDLTRASGQFEVRWFDPRHGGEFRRGSVGSVDGGGRRDLGTPPGGATTDDWVVLVRPAAR